MGEAVKPYLANRACDPNLVHTEQTEEGIRFKNYLPDGTYSEKHSPIRLDKPHGKMKFKNVKGVPPIPLAVNPDVWDTVKESNSIIVAEGCGKAGALVSAGLPAIGILGVDNWHLKGAKTLHPSLANVINKDTYVEFVPDGDWRTNQNVNRAVCEFIAAVLHQGARCNLVEVPGKHGIDDLFAQWLAECEDVVDKYQALPRRNTLPIVERLGPKIATTAPPEPKSVISNLLPCRSTIIQGAGHEGKTVTQLYIAIHIAIGKPIFGQNIDRPGAVLYLFGEDDTDDIRRIVHYLLRNRPDLAEHSTLIDKNLRLVNAASLPNTPQLLVNDAGNYQPGKIWPYVQAILDDGSYSAVFLDTLSSLGLQEATGMNEALAAYHRQASHICDEYSIAVVGSHHVSQNSANHREVGMYSSRGSTATADNARCVLQVQRHKPTEDAKDYVMPQGIDPASDYIARLHVVKHKWSYLKQDQPLWLAGTGYATYDYPEVTGLDAARFKHDAQEHAKQRKIDAAIERILEAVEDYPDLTKSQIKDAAGGTKTDNLKAISKLLGDGIIEEYPLPKRGSGAGRQGYGLRLVKQRKY